MKRLEDLIDQLNLLEKHIANNETIKEVINLRNETISALSKSGSFKEVYELSKSKNLGLNKYLLPYILYRDTSNGRYVYELKSISKFNNDYEQVFKLVKYLKENKNINLDEYIFLKENIRAMYNKFSMQFCKTNLDMLDEDERKNYELYKLEINKMYKKFLNYLSEDRFNKLESEFATLHETTKRLYLISQNKKICDFLKIEHKEVSFVKDFLEYYSTIQRESYSINIIDSNYYSLRLLTQEQIYKIKCSELLKEDLKNKKYINALLEDVDFYKSNYIKEDNIKRTKKHKKK